jgi:hypothetical protein
MEDSELMKKVLNGEPFTNWNDYNRKYNEYITTQYQKKQQREKRLTCLHGSITILPDGRQRCVYCGKIQ